MEIFDVLVDRMGRFRFATNPAQADVDFEAHLRNGKS